MVARSAADIERALRARVTCNEVSLALDDLIASDAIEDEPCSFDCRDGSACLDGTCVRERTLGEACTDFEESDALDESPGPFRACALGLECRRGICEALAGENEACGARTCALGLSCVGGVCRGPLAEGEACRWWQAPDCEAHFECIRGRCRRTDHPDPECEDGLLREVEWRPRRRSCVSVRTPCRSSAECGDGACAGLGDLRCIPTLRTTIDDAPETRLPTCRPTERCDHEEPSCECARGTWCRHDGECAPEAGLGERCEGVHCGPGLECTFVVPSGGRCVGSVCSDRPLPSLDER